MLNEQTFAPLRFLCLFEKRKEKIGIGKGNVKFIHSLMTRNKYRKGKQKITFFRHFLKNIFFK